MLRGPLAIGVAFGIVGCEVLAPLDGLTGGDASVAADAAGDVTGADDHAGPPVEASPTEAAADVALPPDCDGGLTACGTACVDLASDGTDCGRCGHDCGGGGCTGGTCQPFTLVEGQDAPRSVTVSGATVYFTTHGSSGMVAACSTSGCGSSSTVVTQGIALGSGIAVTGTLLFYTAYGDEQDGGGYVGNGAFSCFTAGCESGGALTSSPGNPVGIATDGSFVYWNDSTLGEILSCATNGCGGNPTVVAKNQSAPWYGIAIDSGSTFVYWGDRSGGTVDRCDLPACASGVQALATGLLGPFDLAVDGTDVYFTDYDPSNPTNPGTVEGCAVGGCANGKTVFATQQVTPSGIAVDGSNVYWANNGDGTIVYCPKTGCPASGPTQLATGQSGPFRIALDASFVYWTNTTGGSVMKIAKP